MTKAQNSRLKYFRNICNGVTKAQNKEDVKSCQPSPFKMGGGYICKPQPQAFSRANFIIFFYVYMGRWTLKTVDK